MQLPVAKQIGADAIVPVLALAFGLAVALLGPGSIAVIVATTLLVIGMLRPVALAVFAIGAPFLFNISRVELLAVADLRFFHLVWLVVIAALAARYVTGERSRSGVLSPALLWLAGLLVAWEFVSAWMAGGGSPIYVEVVQTAYFLVVMFLTSVIVANASDSLWMKTQGLSAFLLLGTALLTVPGMIHSALRVPYYSVGVGSGVTLERLDVLQDPGSWMTAYGVPRFGLPGVGPVGSAAVCIVAVLVAIGFRADAGSRFAKRLATAVVVVGCVGLLLSLSRAGWLVGAVAVILMAARTGARRFVTMSAVLVVVITLVVSIPAISSRFDDIANPQEGSYRSHVRLYQTAAVMVGLRPVFGWGPGEFNTVAANLGTRTDLDVNISGSDTHNFILQQAAETGIPGAVLLLSLAGAILVVGHRSLHSRTPREYAFVIGLASLAVMGMTMNAVRTEVFWTVAGITLGLAARSDSDWADRA